MCRSSRFCNMLVKKMIVAGQVRFLILHRLHRERYARWEEFIDKRDASGTTRSSRIKRFPYDI